MINDFLTVAPDIGLATTFDSPWAQRCAAAVYAADPLTGSVQVLWDPSAADRASTVSAFAGDYPTGTPIAVYVVTLQPDGTLQIT